MGQTNAKAEIMKLFQSMGGKHNLYDLWSDFITMTALSMAMAADRQAAYGVRQKVIDQYQQAYKRYDHEEILIFDQIFKVMVEDINANPWQDFLGSLFMELNLGSHWKGQYFTPYDVCRTMARLTVDEGKDNSSCYDPACGAGATMIAAAELLHERGVNYQAETLFVGQDLDIRSVYMCYIQLSLLGCAGYVVHGDTLTDPVSGLMPPVTDNILFTIHYYRPEWEWKKYNWLMKKCGVKEEQHGANNERV